MNLFGSLGQIGASTLLGAASPAPHYAEIGPLNAKVIELRRRGHSVAQTGVGVAPTMWRVDGGPELTNDQLLAL